MRRFIPFLVFWLFAVDASGQFSLWLPNGTTAVRPIGTRDVSFPDSNGTHFYTFDMTGNATAARTISLDFGDAARTITVTGNPTLGGNDTSSSGTPTFTDLILSNLTASKPVFTNGSSQLVSTGTLAVDQGGTGAVTLTDGGVLVGSGTSAITALAAGTNGQLLVGSTGSDPVFVTATDGDGITTTLGAGTFQLDCEVSTATNPGIVELATAAEVVTGADTGRVTTPAGITAKMAAPGAIGGTTPAAGNFTSVDAGDGNIANAGDVALDSVSSDGASIVIGNGDENTYTQTGGTSHAFALGSDSGDDFLIDATKVVVEGDSRYVGIGTAAPKSLLHITGTPNSVDDPALKFLLTLRSDEAYDASPVGGIHISNKFNASGSYAGMGGMTVGKENATDGQYGGYMALFTRAHGSALAEAVRVDSSGNVGIGEAAPDSLLEVSGAIHSTDLDGGAINVTCNASGQLIRDPSDRKFKDHIKPINNALKKVAALKGREFTWNDPKLGGKGIGLIAQEVADVDPRLVGSGEYMSIHQAGIIAMLVEAVKDQQGQIENLQVELQNVK